MIDKKKDISVKVRCPECSARHRVVWVDGKLMYANHRRPKAGERSLRYAARTPTQVCPVGNNLVKVEDVRFTLDNDNASARAFAQTRVENAHAQLKRAEADLSVVNAERIILAQCIVHLDPTVTVAQVIPGEPRE